MADTNFRGPVNSMGPLEDPAPVGAAGTVSTFAFANNTLTVVANVQPQDGPSLSYQGLGMPNLRAVPFQKDQNRPGQQQSFLTVSQFYAIDTLPQAAATAALAASQAATAATAVSLVTTQAAGVAGATNVAVGVPLVPLNQSAVVTALAIDFGFATGTTAANSSTVVVNDNTLFTNGQWIIIAGAGNAAASGSLVTQVTSIATANITGITINPVAATTLANVPIGGADLFGGDFLPPASTYGPQRSVARGWSPYVAAGNALVWNPREGSSRAISVSAGTTTATTALTLTGYDVHGAPMTERITINSGNRSSSTFFASKAFKFLSSVSVSTTAGGSLGLGLSDVFGMVVRADHGQQVQAYWNGCSIGATQVGFTAAYTTAPATNTTGDVRGTLQVSTNGTGSAVVISTAAVTNGTARLVVIQNIGVWNTVAGSPNNPVPTFGIAQSTS
jgi:hypothetical protein